MVHSIEIAVSIIFTVISHCYNDSLQELQIIFNIPEHPDIMAKVHFESANFFSFVIYYHKKPRNHNIYRQLTG